MITTVTTVSTVTSTAVLGFTSVISIAAAVFLILILVAKELSGTKISRLSQVSSRVLNVCIVPMLMVFATTIILRFVEILV